MFPVTHLSLSTSASFTSLNPETGSSLFRPLQKRIEEQNFASAQMQLFSVFRLVSSEEEILQCYEYLFELLPHFESLDLLEKNLNTLLAKSSGLAKYQEQLAIHLGKTYQRLGKPIDAMHAFAKALQIHCSKDNYRVACSCLSAIVHGQLDHFLVSTTPTISTLHLSLEKIQAFKHFCLSEKDLEPFYDKALQRLSIVSSDKPDDPFIPYHEHISKEQNISFEEPSELAIERYWKAFQAWRECFNHVNANLDVSSFQKNVFIEFKKFFQLLVEDAFLLLGPSPCHYDIRAMGSCGREELCPYSDLEFLILIKNAHYTSYFENLVSLLELQIASLGETQRFSFFFSCLKEPNPSGLHIDLSPNIEKRLINTPNLMAEEQDLRKKGQVRGTNSGVEYSMLRTASLIQSSSQLYTNYQSALKQAFSCEERGWDFIQNELRNFDSRWQTPFHAQIVDIDLKDQFVKLLNCLMSDLAIFYELHVTNSFEIVDQLTGLFSEHSVLLLKESLSAIYKIRCRMHDKKQREKASCLANRSGVKLEAKEIDALEKCYWLVLYPIYEKLRQIPSAAEFKKSFQRIDFIEIAFQFSLQSTLAPNLESRWVYHIAFELCQMNAPDMTHLDYFKALSKLSKDHLREAYAQALEDKGHPLLATLLKIPTRSGMRLIYARKISKLQFGLLAITNPFDTQEYDKTSVSIFTPSFNKSRFLKPHLVSALMDGEMIKRTYTKSAHRVCQIIDQGYDFHFKQTPCHPLMEFAIHSFISRIAGMYTPTVELVRFDVCTAGIRKSYPVLISETIPGENLQTAWKKVKPSAAYTWMAICSILTRPRDGRLTNFILDVQGILHSVDNDLSFVEPVVRTGTFSKKVNFSSALFCVLPLTTRLDPFVLEELVALDAQAICSSWLEEIIQKEKEYENLFPISERAQLFNEDPNLSFTSTILFREGALSILYLQFWRLQNAISSALHEKRKLTLGDLLKELISCRENGIGSYVYKAYHNTIFFPEKKQEKATSDTQSQSVTSVEYYKDCCGKTPTLEEIETKMFSPEEAREEFLCTFLERHSHYTETKTGQKGIAVKADFKNLKEAPQREILILKALKGQVAKLSQKPISVTIYSSAELTLNLLEFFLHTQLISLDLWYCSHVNQDFISSIQSKCSTLQNLTIIGCKNLTALKGTYFYPALEFPDLKFLEISDCNIETMAIIAPQLAEVKVVHNIRPFQIDLKAPLLREFDFRECTQVTLLPSAREAILGALEHNSNLIMKAPSSIQKEREKAIQSVRRVGKNLEILPTAFKYDKEVVLAAVHKDGLALEYASKELQNNKDVVLAAVYKDGLALEYAGKELQSNKGVVLAAVQKNGLALRYAGKELQSNKDIVRAAVQRDGWVLQYASKELQSNKDVVLAAVQENGLALEYASKELQSNKDVVFAAVQQNGLALEYAANELQSNNDVVLAALNFQLKMWFIFD